MGGEDCGSMAFIIAGDIEYTERVKMHGVDEQDDPCVIIRPPYWLAEPVLWVKWTHVGFAGTLSGCELGLIDSRKFQWAFAKEAFVRKYAELFHGYLCSNLHIINDVWVDKGELQNIAFRAQAWQENS